MWLMHACDMTHSYMWHDSFTCVTWLIHVCVYQAKIDKMYEGIRAAEAAATKAANLKAAV